MKKADAPLILRSSSEQSQAQGRASAEGMDAATTPSLWIRISAFLSLKSENTQKTYLGILREWSEFLGAKLGSEEGEQALLSATDVHAAAYKRFLERQPGQKPRLKSSRETGILPYQSREKEAADGLQSSQANATIAKKFAALRRIYRMLMAFEPRIRHNPFDSDRVPAPSPRSGQKRPTEMVDFNRVMDIIASPGVEDEKSIRDSALLALLFAGALRRSELTKIRLGDVRRTQEGTYFVRLRATKAKRDADQALPNWAYLFIERLLKVRLQAGAQSGDYLFVSYRGHAGKSATKHPLSESGVYKLFKKYCSRAGIEDVVSPHSARATAITKLLSQGISHREVQEFSRHSSVQMVEVYDKRRLSIDENPAKDLKY